MKITVLYQYHDPPNEELARHEEFVTPHNARSRARTILEQGIQFERDEHTVYVPPHRIHEVSHEKVEDHMLGIRQGY